MTNDSIQNEPLLMTARQASTELFCGVRSEWDLLNAAKKRLIPSVRVGNRVFFSPEAIREWIRQQSADSIRPDDTPSMGGIRRLK